MHKYTRAHAQTYVACRTTTYPHIHTHLAEPALEILICVEDSRHQEIKQIPQLVDVVLKRRACQNKLPFAHILLHEHREELAVFVFEPVALLRTRYGFKG